MSNVFDDVAFELLEMAKRLPESSFTRRAVASAAREAIAEAYLDADGFVTGHPFRGKRGTAIDRRFCAECNWNRDKHR